MKARLAVALPLVLLLAGSIPQSQGDKYTVTRKETKLRSGKRLFATPVADLHEGDKLAYVDQDLPWLQVKFQDVVGWIHSSEVSDRPDVRLSGEGVRESYSASETAAGRKGFNPTVERSYRQNNPGLESAFRAVDRIQSRKAGDAEVKAFLEQGGLLPESGK
jgi:hypothetical protein